MNLQTGMEIISINHKFSTPGLNQGRRHDNKLATKPQQPATQICNLSGNPLVTTGYGARSCFRNLHLILI